MKTYKMQVITAAATASGENDHFLVRNPKTGNSRYVRPHRKSLTYNEKEHSSIVKIWQECVNIKNNSSIDEEQTIDLTLNELKLIQKHNGY